MSGIDRTLTEKGPWQPASAASSSRGVAGETGSADTPVSAGSTSSLATSAPMARSGSRVWGYVSIARVDHWFKNAFMLLGVVLAFFYEPDLFQWSSFVKLAVAVAATCLIASSNYVLNELLDGARDRMHPEKRHRPVPSGLVNPVLGYAEWIIVGAAGFLLALTVNWPFGLSALGLWLLGGSYNVAPIP